MASPGNVPMYDSNGQLVDSGMQPGVGSGGGNISGYGPLFPLTDPTLQTWAWVNQGDATVATNVVAGSKWISLEAPIQASRNLRIRKKATPSAPYVVDVTFLVTRPVWGDAGVAGVLWRESSSGKLVTYTTLILSGAAKLSGDKWNSPTSANSGYFQFVAPGIGVGLVFRLLDDGTNRECWLSLDGLNFILVHSVGRTDFMTADEIGFLAEGYHTGTTFMNVLSWYEH